MFVSLLEHHRYFSLYKIVDIVSVLRKYMFAVNRCFVSSLKVSVQVSLHLENINETAPCGYLYKGNNCSGYMYSVFLLSRTMWTSGPLTYVRPDRTRNKTHQENVMITN